MWLYVGVPIFIHGAAQGGRWRAAAWLLPRVLLPPTFLFLMIFFLPVARCGVHTLFTNCCLYLRASPRTPCRDFCCCVWWRTGAGGGASRATTIGFGAGAGFGSTYADTKRAFEQLSVSAAAPAVADSKGQGADASPAVTGEAVVVKE